MPYSQQHADAACNFFEIILRHTADEWYGKPFLLAPWQEEGLQQIFGPLDDEGNRLVKMAYFEVPKKAGKTEWTAGIVLFVLLVDPNPGCQVYGAAAATRQAMNVYRAACKMVEQSPMLRLASLPLRYEWHDYLLVHGSPREPTTEYILPRDADWPAPGMFQELFDRFQSVCLVGHTHMAGIFEEGPRFTPQKLLGETFRSGEGKMIVNVGSVGQPRDHDWRACYLSVEDGVFRFHRVEYPVAVTQKKIRAIPELDNRLADRLVEGV